MLDEFVQHPNNNHVIKSRIDNLDEQGWNSDPTLQLLDIDNQNGDLEDTIFELTQVQFSPPSHIVNLTVINNHLFILLETGQILQINLLQADIIDNLDITSTTLSRNAKVYVDPTLKHLIVVDTTENGVHYIHTDTRRAKLLPKLSRLGLSTLHFVNTRSSSFQQSAVILVGTFEGNVYQSVINPNPSDIFRKNSEERQIKLLFSFKESIVDIRSHINDDRKSAVVFVITKSRTYTFIGPFGRMDNDGGVGFEGVFSQSPFSIKISESGLSSHTSFNYDVRLARNSLSPPKSIAWLCDKSLYNAKLDLSSHNPEMVFQKSTLTDVDVEAKSILLTEHHCLCLYQGGIKSLRLLDGAVIWDEPLPDTIIGMQRDDLCGTFWLYSHDSIYELTVRDEDRDVWTVYLSKREFDNALKVCKNTQQREIILAKQADVFFAQGKYIQSAQAYAQSTTKAFETVVLKFVDANERDSLRYYLSARLERTRKADLTQRMMLATWMLEIYLDKLNQLEDLMASESTEDDTENAKTEYSMMEDDLKTFLSTYKNNLDRKVVYDSFKIHGRYNLLLEYASYVEDWSTIVEDHVHSGRWNDVLETLPKQALTDKKNETNRDLYYRYAFLLLREASEKTIEIWKREPRLELKRLIPALIQTEKLSKESRRCAIDYLLWRIDSDGSQEAIAHNLYINLLSKDSENEDELVEYLKRTPTPKFDVDFALRLFDKRGLNKACIQVYAIMKLYDCSVDLAINSGDLNLAKVYADKPTDDPILRKKLWLRIARVIVQDQHDIKSAMQFLEGSDVLQLEDILPFFPSFEVVDDFKEEICNALDRYSSRIQDLQVDMDESARTSQRIKDEMEKLKDRYVVISPNEKCALSGKSISGCEFYVFPTQRVYRADALLERLTTYAEPSTLKRIIELQSEIEGVKTTPKSSYFTGERLRELIVPSTINQIFNTSTKRRKDVSKLRKELDEILTKSDPLVEESIINIDKPFASINQEWNL
ncbi:hypothetical protein E3Q00_03899 [Wallemia mellicola]|nr:hypothetical protein E3Q00_03899 [Wallemia mellicola]